MCPTASESDELEKFPDIDFDAPPTIAVTAAPDVPDVPDVPDAGNRSLDHCM